VARAGVQEQQSALGVAAHNPVAAAELGLAAGKVPYHHVGQRRRHPVRPFGPQRFAECRVCVVQPAARVGNRRPRDWRGLVEQLTQVRDAVVLQRLLQVGRHGGQQQPLLLGAMGIGAGPEQADPVRETALAVLVRTDEEVLLLKALAVGQERTLGARRKA